MVIANFREYTAVLRDVYSRDAMGEIGAYYQALTNSGEELKQQKLRLLEQIGARKREIDRQAQLIRTATDKKAAGLRLARIKKQKQDMIRTLKVLQNGDHFNVLSDEAKTGVCSGFLLQKYLTRELLEHNPLNFAKDANGNLLVDTERLKHSAIFQEAVHLRDFVAAYMAKYPDKVKTPGHFKTPASRELKSYAFSPAKTSSWCVCVRLKRWTTKRPEWTTAWEKAAMTPPF